MRLRSSGSGDLASTYKRFALRAHSAPLRIPPPDPTIGGVQSFVIDRGEQVHSLEAAKALAIQPTSVVPVEDDEEIEDEALPVHGGAFGEQLDRLERGQPAGRSEIGGHCVGPPAGSADLINHGLRLIATAAVMDDDVSAGGRECQGGGTAHAA